MMNVEVPNDEGMSNYEDRNSLTEEGELAIWSEAGKLHLLAAYADEDIIYDEL
jgi:hypothetical protein